MHNALLRKKCINGKSAYTSDWHTASAIEMIATVITSGDKTTHVNLKLPTPHFCHLYKLLIGSGDLPCSKVEKRRECVSDFKLLKNTVLK